MLKNDQHPDAIKQTFYIGNKEDNVTLKEAYNLMSGRAIFKEKVNKEGEKYTAWQQLNFKETDTHGNFKLRTFNENYGFDLKAILQNHPIKELQNETDSQRLIESLERGNRQSVTLTIQGKNKRYSSKRHRNSSRSIFMKHPDSVSELINCMKVIQRSNR